MALISTLQEDWTTINPAIWNNWGGTPYVTNPGGVLTLANNAGTTNYYGINTQVAYDLTGVAASVQIISLPTVTLPADASFSVGVLNAEIDSNNRYFWSWEGNVLVAFKVTAGVYSYLDDIALTGINYVRIREASAVVYYEYSADGISWTELVNVATTGVAVTALTFGHAIGHYEAVATAYQAELDNFNILPEPSEGVQGNFFALLA